MADVVAGEGAARLQSRDAGRSRALVLGVMFALAAALLGVWAGRTAVATPSGPSEGEEPTLYEVAVGSVGKRMTFAVQGSWRTEPVGVNGAAGVVTTVEVEPDAPVEMGDVLFTIDLRPVVAAEGAVPMFRDLTVGDHGADVDQLNAMLRGLGLLNAEPKTFDYRTRSAVRAWQAQLGVAQDGQVRSGDLVFLPQLPARLVVTDISPGTRLAGGESVLRRLPEGPDLVMTLAPEQAAELTAGMSVEVAATKATWEGVIERVIRSDEQVEVQLGTDGGGPVCGSQCLEHVPLSGTAVFVAHVVVVPEVTGPVVPVAGLHLGPDNRAYVVDAAGERRDVEVVESANGLIVVEGVDAGTTIRLGTSRSDAP